MQKPNILRFLVILLLLTASSAMAANSTPAKTNFYSINLPISLKHMNAEKKVFDEHHAVHTNLYRGKIGDVDAMLSISVLTLKPDSNSNKRRMQREYLKGMLGGVNRALSAADTSHEFIETEQPVKELMLGKRMFHHMQIETFKHHINMYTTIANDRLYSFSITLKTKDKAALNKTLEQILSAIKSTQFYPAKT